MSDSLVVGAPGVLAAWVHALVREAATLATNAPEIRVLDRHDDASFLGVEVVDHDRIFLCNFPSASLVEKVAAGVVPTLAILDEPADTVRFIKQQSGAPFFEILRVCSVAQTINRAFYENPSIMIVYRGLETSAAELLDFIAECLGIRLTFERLGALKERHALGNEHHSLEEVLSKNVSGWTSLEESARGLTFDEATTVSQALAPLVHYAFDADPPPIVWPQKLFLSGDRPNEQAPVIAELTGGARNIIYGPYMYLPPGDYLVHFTVGFSQELRGMPFRLKVTQLCGEKVLTEIRCVAPGGGIFEGNFVMDHTISNESIEIVLSNEEGAIEGRVALIQVSFQSLKPGAKEVIIANTEFF